MKPFLQTHRLALTPLSPIHIGCGEDFLPTNYVIVKDALYGFDPSQAIAGKMVDELQKLVDARSPNLLAIQKLFYKNAADIQPWAQVLVPVSSGVVSQYQQRIGQVAQNEGDGTKVINRLAIERHSYTGADQAAYIPGSSFKGCLRTAWLDHINAGHVPPDTVRENKSTANFEKELFRGDFQNSPLRLLKVADFMPAPGQELERRVLFAINHKKAQVLDRAGQERTGRGPTTRKECILHGQFRALVAEGVLGTLEAVQGKADPKELPHLEPQDWRTLAKYSNAYHLPRLLGELAMLERRNMGCERWRARLAALLKELEAPLQKGEMFLVRLGRFGGAESKTLSGKGVARIKILEGRSPEGRQQSSFHEQTKTIWLAAEQEDDRDHALPFGWAVVEINPGEPCTALQTWCAAQSANKTKLSALREELHTLRAAAMQKREEQRRLAEEQARTKQEQERAQKEREQAIAQMTEQGRRIEQLRQRCEEWHARMPPHGNYKHQAANHAQAGLFQDAHRLINQAVTEGWSTEDKATLAKMLEEWLPKVVALRGKELGKDERKKLQWAKLCNG
ncbi:RAMP superfamily CRISPR-associated protein [Candidatus Symbiobacter mobilis]|uniref:CRISPR system Cms protein Csm5 n=1 Tax=Candidatus Symbiobacter mobilis CR TaxID=946483 RepID=U5N6L2_9BURK|nr:RAMP superfamily CRISPR-associated protein [Candidatus Symbiobacter mobilis]AGX86915.1 hypothetical protein Cenrod_0809 [Candidatus Symbiobacter mobilis CR]